MYTRELSAAEMKVLGQAKRRPISYWKLNGNGDDSAAGGAYDLSVYHQLGGTWHTTGGAPTPFSNGGYLSIPEKIDISDHTWYVAGPNPAWDNAGGQVTVAAWVRLPSSGRSRNVLTMFPNGDYFTYQLRVEEGVVKAEVRSPSGTVTTVTTPSGSSLMVNQWVHLAFTFSKNNMLRLYVQRRGGGLRSGRRHSPLAGTLCVCRIGLWRLARDRHR